MSSGRDPVTILAGSGRSGTSWLLDALTLHRDYRGIFEPLNWVQVRSARHLYGLYLEAEDEHEPMKSFFRDVFYRRPPEAWIRWMHFGITEDTPYWRKFLQVGYNFPKFRFWARRRVVKLIKGNLMLMWLQRNFDVRIIFLIRHPCAVVASQRHMGWDTRTERFLSQERLMRTHLAGSQDLIRSASTELEKLAILWSIENIVPLRQIATGMLNATCCFYENLVSDPKGQLCHLLSEIGIAEPEIGGHISRIMKTMPPHMTSMSAWRQRLNPQEIDQILTLTHGFGITGYGPEPEPLVKIEHIINASTPGSMPGGHL